MNQAFLDSERAQQAVAEGFEMYVSADLLQAGVVKSEGIALDESDAEVTVDGTALVRRTFSMTIPDPELYLPLSSNSLLSPFLTEIRVWSGIRYPNGDVDRWSVFTGPIEDPTAENSDGEVRIKIEASDRAQAVDDRRVSKTLVVPGGMSAVDGIRFIIDSVYPGITWEIESPLSNPFLDQLIIEELESAMEHADTIAKSYGMEVFFLGNGNGKIRPVPDPETQARVWTFAPGELSTLKSTELKISSKSSASHAIVVGLTMDGVEGVRSDRYDTDPLSPTYFDPASPLSSAFGDRPTKLASNMIYEQSQSDVACDALLSRKKGAVQEVRIATSPITAFDEHDVVGVTNAKLEVDAAFSIDFLNIPCNASGEMSMTFRSRRV